MLKFVALLLLVNIQMHHIQSCVIFVQQTSDSISTDIANDPESSGISTSTPESSSTNCITGTTEAPSTLSLIIDKRIWNLFDFSFLSKLETISTTSSPLVDYQPAASDNDDRQADEKTIKITFAGRTNFRVRKNCRCLIHGRCARRDMCD